MTNSMLQAWKPLLDKLSITIGPALPVMYFLVAVGIIACICIMTAAHRRGGKDDE